jgi:succinyl-CoA synthetase beta subunit
LFCVSTKEGKVKLHEYQSKRIFAKYGVPIPEGDVATTPTEARQIAQRLGGPVVVKSQVLVGGRGKAGGIKVAKDADEAEELFSLTRPPTSGRRSTWGSPLTAHSADR